MGDRTTPMKFGPEWLRNLSREPSSSGIPSASGVQSNTPPIRSPGSSIAAPNPNTMTSSNPSKVLLAKLRYGREEMLALYDRQTAEAPSQLKSIDLLYQPRGKPPYALNNNFEEDTRESTIRNNPPIGVMNTQDRYGPVRGRGIGLSMGRGINIVEGRGRARGGYVRQNTIGSDTFRAPGWHNGGQRSYPGTPDDDPNPPRGVWNNGIGVNPPGIRPSAEQADWASKMAYRNTTRTRQNHTNWRQQQNRDEGEEWRSTDGARRGQEKWEREWPERGPQEKGWSTNRRQWSGDASEDTLPEWAVENSEACGGTFDSSGAFHGYSNDDSNIPKAQDSSYPLARSHTHGSFAQDFKRFAKRRFDATEVKFKKPADETVSEETGNPPSAPNEGANVNSGPTTEITKPEITRNQLPSKDEPHGDNPDQHEEAATKPGSRDDTQTDDKDINFQTNYNDNPQASSQQRVDMLRRNEESDSTTERATYKSVMMTSNNNHLRQQHQNIGTPTIQEQLQFQQLLESQNIGSEKTNQQKQQETKLVEDMLDMHLSEEIQAQLLNSTTQTGGIPNSVSSMSSQISSPGMQMRMNNPLIMKQTIGMNQPDSNTPIKTASETNIIRPIGITNSMLNASLGLPIGTGANMSMPMSNMSAPPIPNPGMLTSTLQGLGAGNLHSAMQGMQSGNMQVGGLQTGMQVSGMPANSYQTGIPGNMQGNLQTSAMNNTTMQSATVIPGYQVGVGSNSLFMQNAPNPNPGDIGNHAQQNMYQIHPGHSLQQSAQNSFNAASLYGNMMQSQPVGSVHNLPLTEQWYYEDPKKTIQGPFTAKEMYGWYRAGFFTPDLLVRRACESVLMPLANYGIMPFGPIDILPPQFNQPTRFDMRQQSAHDNMMNAQQVGLGPEVESLWNQPTANDIMWVQQMQNPCDVKNIGNMSMYFWEQPSGMSSSMLPEGLPKEMKTEDEILAQMRAAQGDAGAQNLTFISDVVSPEEAFAAGTNIAPNLEELQKLIGNDICVDAAPAAPGPSPAANNASVGLISPRPADTDKDKPSEKTAKTEALPETDAKQQTPAKVAEPKPSKQVKTEDKSKSKEVPKIKNKKTKDEKKEDSPESKKEEEIKTNEKRLDELSPPKNKREEKATKKDLEKEKKEWLKDGFTIVKGADKKDSKKKEKEEARAVEEAERKRKEEEKRALEAEKNCAPEPVTRRQQLEQGQARQSQLAEHLPKKAPWSAQSAQVSREGLALSDIQRLEREKKLEHMKEQQQMMQALAQQQAAAALKEQQEMQSGQLGWAKKKQPNNSPPGQSLAEIQAEARKQAAATAAMAAAAREEAQPTPPPVNITPWGATNGGGFWETASSANASASDRAGDHAAVSTKASEPKPKKKVTVVAPPKKEVSPSTDFNTWCTTVLSNWKDASNIDIPTFVAFLRDIESPYEIKDYVKCYLGDTKEANDFARQFLERRSRLLRVGMVTPSDDLCSPAAAITPRTNSGSDYTEVKSKANKKTKKNKMLKVDARILGFSVTASEDRINIGDIDSV